MRPSLTELRGIIWGMMALTTIVFFSRAFIRVRSPLRMMIVDYILTFAYVCFLALSILYLATVGSIYRWQSATAKETEMYPDYVADLILMRKVMLIGAYVLWCILWAVKASFLSLYWKLVRQLPVFKKMWWIVTGFTLLTFIGNIPAHLMSCRKMDFFEAAGCLTRQDELGQLTSLYYSFAADITTDLAIMFLPLAVLRKLQVDNTKKIGIGALFSIGWICIGIAVVRVVKLGEGQGQFIPGWLAMWGTIEAAVAVMVGCGPGLYVSAKEAYKSRSGRSYNYGTGVSANGRQTPGQITNVSASDRKWYATGGSRNSWTRFDDGDTAHNRSKDIKVESRFEMTEYNRKDSDGDELNLTERAWPLAGEEKQHSSGSHGSIEAAQLHATSFYRQ